MPAIGRIAQFSSLRKHRPKEHQIYDSYFGKGGTIRARRLDRACVMRKIVVSEKALGI